MSLQSMTGFASVSDERDGLQFSLELRSVNSRFLDVNCRLPQSLANLEQAVIKKIKEKIARGRVDVYLNLQANNGGSKKQKLELNSENLQQFLAVAEQALGNEFNKVRADLITRALERREIVSQVNVEESQVQVDQEFLFSLLDSALDKLVQMRDSEGAALRKALEDLLESLQNIHQQIKSKLEGQVERLQSKLSERIAKLLGDASLAPERLAQEVAYQVDRADVTEELVRLSAHFVEFSKNIDLCPVGKKLDFLLQEALREFNTIGSKCQDAGIAKEVIDAKSTLEQMKEQVANVV